MRVHVWVVGLGILLGVGIGLGLGLMLADSSGSRPPVSQAAAEAEPRPKPVTPLPEAPTPNAPTPQPVAEPAQPQTQPQPRPTDPAPNYETYTLRAAVVDHDGNPMPGIAFTFRPNLTSHYEQLPDPADHADEAAYVLAVEAHARRIARMRVDGEVEVVTNGDGILLIPNAITNTGTVESASEGHVIYGGPRQAMRESQNKSARIVLWPAATLELEVYMPDGSPVESCRARLRRELILTRPETALVWVLSEVPMTLRVPAGKFRLVLENLTPAANEFEQEVTIRAGQHKHLVIRLPVPPETGALTVLPHSTNGNGLMFRIMGPISEPTEYHLARQAMIRQKAPDIVDGVPKFEGLEPGLYLLGAYGFMTDVNVAHRQVHVGPGENETTLETPFPGGWLRLTVYLTKDGTPLSDDSSRSVGLSIQPLGYRKFLLWDRHANRQVIAYSPEARDVENLHVHAMSRQFGRLSVRFDAGADTLHIDFKETVKVTLTLTNVRPEFQEHNIYFRTAMRLTSGGTGSVTAPSRVESDNTTRVIEYADLQPGLYVMELRSRGLYISFMPIHLADVLVASSDIELTVAIPNLYALAVKAAPGVANENRVEVTGNDNMLNLGHWTGSFQPFTEAARRVPNGIGVAYLPAGKYTLRWKDSDDHERTREVTVNADKEVVLMNTD